MPVQRHFSRDNFKPKHLQNVVLLLPYRLNPQRIQNVIHEILKLPSRSPYPRQTLCRSLVAVLLVKYFQRSTSCQQKRQTESPLPFLSIFKMPAASLGSLSNTSCYQYHVLPSVVDIYISALL